MPQGELEGGGNGGPQQHCHDGEEIGGVKKSVTHTNQKGLS